MKIIDITTILGTELKSRTSARDFATYLQNMKVQEADVDFSRVNSITRSFMDEFYQLLLKKDKSMEIVIHLQNMNQQADAFLKSVEQTSIRPRPTVEGADNACFLAFHTVSQLNEYLESLK